MTGIKLITQMIFLLLYFIFPSQEEPVLSAASRDMSFMYSSIGGFYSQVENGPLASAKPEESVTVDKMNADAAEEPEASLAWEDEYEIPERVGNALITSKKVQIVSGPYAGITLTSDEVEMMECVIQRETDGTFKHRKIIAELILNRVASEKFPDTVAGVLTAPRQFTTIKNYYTKKRPPDELTKRAVYEVLVGIGEYNSEGALYFYDPVYANPSSAKWFEDDLVFCFALEGHRFFK